MGKTMNETLNQEKIFFAQGDYETAELLFKYIKNTNKS